MTTVRAPVSKSARYFMGRRVAMAPALVNTQFQENLWWGGIRDRALAKAEGRRIPEPQDVTGNVSDPRGQRQPNPQPTTAMPARVSASSARIAPLSLLAELRWLPCGHRWKKPWKGNSRRRIVLPVFQICGEKVPELRIPGRAASQVFDWQAGRREVRCPYCCSCNY